METMQEHEAENESGDSSRGDGDSTSTKNASNTWLFEQTIRSHEERIRANGVLCCELWFCNGYGEQAGGGDRKPDIVSHWRRNTSKSVVANNDALLVRPKKNYDSHPRRLDNEENTSDSMLGEQLANHLWSHHKTRSDPNILWHRVSSLNDIAEDSQAPERQPQIRDRSFEDAFKSSSASNTVIDWVASISFDVPSGDLENGGGNSGVDSTNVQGMVCWLFAPTTKSENYPSIDVESKQLPALEGFLRSATNHIAVTYALESSFKYLTLPERKSQPLSNASNPRNPRNPSNPTKSSNPTEIITNENISNISTQKLSPDVYHRDDTIYVRNKGEEKNATESALEIKGFGESANENHDDAESVHDCKTESVRKIQAYFRKWLGGGQHPPQPLCWRQTLFTFVGSYVTINLIHWFNVLMTAQRGKEMSYQELSLVDITTASGIEKVRAWCEDYNDDVAWEALEMGPFGAACVLVFAMTSMGPSQPRSMFLGTSIGMIVGKLIGYLESVGVGVGVRMPLATALTASIMAQTCTIYPPAAALALIFSSQLLGWDKMVLQVVGTILIIFLGVVINNLHPMRKYPSFWFGIEEGCYKKDRVSQRRRASSACRSIP